MLNPWLNAMASAKMRRPIRLRFIEEGETVGYVGGLELLPGRKLINGLDSVLLCYCGPAVLNNDSELISRCVGALIDYAREQGYNRLQLRSWGYPYQYRAPTEDFALVTRREFILDLRAPLSEVLGRMNCMIRRKIRSARNSGITYHETQSCERVKDLLALLESTRQARLAKGHQPYTPFYTPYLDAVAIEELLRSGFATLTYALMDEQVISAHLTLVGGNRAYYLCGGSDRLGYELNANSLLFHGEIQRFHEKGLQDYNLGGVQPDTGANGLVFFKEALGAQPRQCTHGNSAFLQGSVNYLCSKFLDKVRGWSFSF